MDLCVIISSVQFQTEVPFKKIMITDGDAQNIHIRSAVIVKRQIPKITTDDHYYQSFAAMTRCKLVALKFLSTF